MIIASGPGGGFDLWGRMVARHIGKHLPGKPNVMPQNMPGAGGFIAANHIYNVAPKDGTAMAIIPARHDARHRSWARPARASIRRRFTWVGTPATETPRLRRFQQPAGEGARRSRTFNENELVVGSTGPGAGTAHLAEGAQRRCSA